MRLHHTMIFSCEKSYQVPCQFFHNRTESVFNLSLKDLVSFFGWIKFMVWFKGITDHTECFSKEPIQQWWGNPFHLNQWIKVLGSTISWKSLFKQQRRRHITTTLSMKQARRRGFGMITTTGSTRRCRFRFLKYPWWNFWTSTNPDVYVLLVNRIYLEMNIT